MLVEWTGTNWKITTSDGTSIHPTSTGQYPEKTGWPDIAGQPVSLDFDTYRIDDAGELVVRSYTDILASINLDKDELVQYTIMAGGGCGVKEMLHYNQGTIENMTGNEVKKAIGYIKNTECGVGHLEPLYDSNGEVLYDTNGLILLAQPEGA